MNNDEYLWDRTGEPDPEVQQLEEILGTLRYQPQPLRLPETVVRPNVRWSRFLAIAAAVALVVFGLSLWMATRRTSNAPVVENGARQSPKEQRAAAGPIDEKKRSDLHASADTSDKQSGVTPSVPVKRTQKHRRAPMPATTSPEQIARARAAKEQLMSALRVTSSKLNFAQRKFAGNTIHNQHKIG